MSYPRKIDRETVTAAALRLLEQHGLAQLSMRTLAAELGVTPNALYRHVANKAALEYALADAAGHLLLDALQQALTGEDTLGVILAGARAYLGFARARPAVYEVMMRWCRHDGTEPPSHTRIWELVLAMAASLPGDQDHEQLALALWAYLHGLVELDRASMMSAPEVDETLLFGLKVFVAGLLAAPNGA